MPNAAQTPDKIFTEKDTEFISRRLDTRSDVADPRGRNETRLAHSPPAPPSSPGDGDVSPAASALSADRRLARAARDPRPPRELLLCFPETTDPPLGSR